MSNAPVQYRNKLTMLGIIEPEPWAYDRCKRREPVFDVDHDPPLLIRKVGWRHCLRCGKPYFSDDVVRLRLCTNGNAGCRTDDERFV